MPEQRITDEDLELLGDLGVDTAPAATGGRPAREQRIIAGFEEIERFVDEHGRPPQHGEDRDIFERMYATRLDSIRASAECRAVLEGLDPRGLLAGTDPVAAAGGEDEESDEELLASLGLGPAAESDITRLVHVRSREEIRAAEEVAQRNPCEDFGRFQPVFEQVQRELDAGERRTVKYADDAGVQQGDLFVLDGQKVLVADLGEPFVGQHGRPDRRLRVIYDNGTESDLLVRSLQRALNKDKASRRITTMDLGPLFAGTLEDGDQATGYVYVLRSKSDHPFVAERRQVLHKIGVTGGDVKARVANAKKDPTYLLADVDVVTTYKLANVDRKALEGLLHRFFGSVRLDVELKDRFGSGVEPREWFLAPLPAIAEAVERIRDGSIEHFRYDANLAQLVVR